jgi:uncharacterized protein
MLSWFQKLMPKEDKFFDLFELHAATLVAGAEALKGLLDGSLDVPAGSREVLAQEDRADEITARVMVAVGRTFITPFDRSDIEQLIGSMDDAIDQMKKAVKTITLYEVDSFSPAMKDLGFVIVEAAQRLNDLLPMLRDIKKHSDAMTLLTREIGRLEEKSDELQVQGLKDLFKTHRDGNAMAFIVGAEVFDHLEKVVDRFEDVARRVSRIALEHL